jgi:hypothetical protein
MKLYKGINNLKRVTNLELGKGWKRWYNFKFPQYLEQMIYFCQLLNVHGVNCIKQIEINAAVALASELSSFEAESYWKAEKI